MELCLRKVIFSITELCNFKCKFCFPNHGSCGGLLSVEGKVEVIAQLAQADCREITFVGGEPTLCTELGNLIKQAKGLGMITKIVTNGTGLSEMFLAEMVGYLDYITISVDSLDSETMKAMGRQQRSMTVVHCQN